MDTRPRLITACMAKNEAGKFLRSALAAWSDFSDEVLLLDDGSTDDTLGIAKKAGARWRRRGAAGAWGAEAPARAELWNFACEWADAGDYILITDADQTPARDPRPLLAAEPDAIAFPLYDLWSPNEYRCDGFWQGHRTPRVWCVKRSDAPPAGWQFGDRGVHCGHFPLGLRTERVVYAPTDFSLLHYAYSTPALRAAKYAQYRTVADQLTPFERAHAESILDPDPLLSPLAFTPQYTLTLEKTP